MTHLRKMMLEELERRNYAQTTIDCYLRAVAEFSLVVLFGVIGGILLALLLARRKQSAVVTQ